MPNDAKLGLVIGVGIVIALGVLHYRSEPQPRRDRPRPDAAAVNPGRPDDSYRLTGSGSAPADGPALPDR